MGCTPTSDEVASDPNLAAISPRYATGRAVVSAVDVADLSVFKTNVGNLVWLS